MKFFCSKLVWSLTLGAIALYAGEDAVQPRRITSVVRADPKTGKLVRSVTVTTRSDSQQKAAATGAKPRLVTATAVGLESAAPTAAATELQEAVNRIAAQNSLPPQLIHSVIKVESNYNALAVSSKGAEGLMQLIPATARRFGVADSFNPMDNIQGGAKYLKYLLDLYHNDYALALAAYNAGEGAVTKYGTVPPYPETQNYLHQVADQLKKWQTAGASGPGQAAKPVPQGAGQSQPASQPAEAAPEPIKHMQQIVNEDGTVRYVSR